MRALLTCLATLAVLHFSAHAEDAPAVEKKRRKTVPIAGGWLLTAEKIEKTKTEGARTLLLTATGSPVLKRATKIIGGKADISAKAGRIECDFVEKKLILSDSPEFRELDRKTGTPLKTITGEAATVIEVALRYGEPGAGLKTTGPNKVTVAEVPQ